MSKSEKVNSLLLSNTQILDWLSPSIVKEPMSIVIFYALVGRKQRDLLSKFMK